MIVENIGLFVMVLESYTCYKLHGQPMVMFTSTLTMALLLPDTVKRIHYKQTN